MDPLWWLIFGLLSLNWLPNFQVGWFTFSTLLLVKVFCRNKIGKGALFFALGILWSLLSVRYRPHLSSEAYDVPLEITGVVTEAPKRYENARLISFLFKVDSVAKQDLKKGVMVKLFYYGNVVDPPIELKNRYRIITKLKIPHGYRNDGVMDIEKYYFIRGIVGIGEVKQLFFLAKMSLSWREKLIIKVKKHLKNGRLAKVILAITLGNNAEITQEDWKIIQVTGIGFLIAISGLHINLIFKWLQKWINYVFKLVWFPSNFSNELSLFITGFYCYLAGFNVPVQRAFISLLVQYLRSRCFLPIDNWLIYKISIFIVLFMNPINSLSLSFWLSFSSVAILLFLREFRVLNTEIRLLKKTLNKTFLAIVEQFKLLVMLLPLTGYFFGGWYDIVWLTTLLSIPWWNLLIIPFSIGGIFMLIICPYVGSKILILAHYLLLANWYFLERLSIFAHQVNYPINNLLELLFCEFAVILVLLPKKRLKLIGIFFLIPWPINHFQLKFTLLDVGQGLSAIIQTPKHTLIYDTGPSIGTSDAGERIVLPFLRFNKIKQVDKVIISHGDDDHRGGLKGLNGNIRIQEMITSEPDRLGVQHPIVKSCLTEPHFVWEGIHFQMYQADDFKGNNGSCVLKVYTDRYSILLPGDLEKRGEKALLKQGIDLKSDILIAPHHGSKGAMDSKFFDQVHPKWVLFPVGYRNRFRFPYFKFRDFFASGTKFLETSKTGSIQIIINQQRMKIILQRYPFRKFWDHYYQKLANDHN